MKAAVTVSTAVREKPLSTETYVAAGICRAAATNGLPEPALQSLLNLFVTHFAPAAEHAFAIAS